MFKVSVGFILFFLFNHFFAARNIREELDREELGTVMKSLVSLQFKMEDGRKPLVPRDEEGQTQELRSEQGEARYGTITDYPAGTVLLETRMHYGEISYQVPDVVKRVDEWQPPDENKAHLKEKYGSTPTAKIERLTVLSLRYLGGASA